MAKVKLHILGGWAYPAPALDPLRTRLADLAEVTSHAFTTPVEKLPREKGSWWLAGWSLGGMRALQAVADRKLKPAGLILFSSTTRFCRDGSYEAGVEKVALRVMMLGLKAKRERVLRNFFEQSMSPDEDRGEAIETRIAQADVFSDDELLDGLNQLEQLDLRPQLAEIKMPVIIFHGRHDAIIPVDAAKYLAARLPDASLEVFDHAGHELVMHHADSVADHLASALQ